MFPYIDEQGRVWRPQRAEGPDGLIGDAWVELVPDDPEYRRTLAALEAPAESKDSGQGRKRGLNRACVGLLNLIHSSL